MGKILNFLMTENWEQYKRVNLYEDIGNSVRQMSKEELIELQKMLNKVKKLKK